MERRAVQPRRLAGGMLAGLVVAGLAGCGGGVDGPKVLVPVAGNVRLNGEPLKSAGITFIPRGTTKGAGGFGGTGASGTYEMLHVTGKKGVEPGEYVVAFSKFALPNGDPIPEGKNATDVGARESLPKYLSSPQLDNPKHIVTVKEGKGETFDFDLKVGKGK